MGAESENDTSRGFVYMGSEKERSFPEKAARVAGQTALGLAEAAVLPYELAAATQQSQAMAQGSNKKAILEDMMDLERRKSLGIWNQKSQELYDHYQMLLKNPEELAKVSQPSNIGISGMIEKATGIDTAPEGVLEHGARWASLLKQPQKIWGAVKSAGETPFKALKSLLPSGTEAARGLGAGIAIEAAQEGDYGPIGILTAAVAGDLIAGGAAGAGKAAIRQGVEILASPKQYAAKLAAKLVPAEKQAMQADIISSLRASGIQANLGTITGNNIAQLVESKLAASGLTGKPLQALKENIIADVKGQYENISNKLSEQKFQTSYEAGESLKRGIEEARNVDKEIYQDLYSKRDAILKPQDTAGMVSELKKTRDALTEQRLALRSAPEDARSAIHKKIPQLMSEESRIMKEFESGQFVRTNSLLSSINTVEKQLGPSALKSPEQKAVISALGQLKQDIHKIGPGQYYSDVKSLTNAKTALHDLINYEVQGGAKQLLKKMAADIDSHLLKYGKRDTAFAEANAAANKKFAEHAKTFRNPNIDAALKSYNPEKVLNFMNSTQGIKDVQKALSSNPDLFNALKRYKVEDMVGKNFLEGTANQLNLQHFSSLLKNKKNVEVLKEILGKDYAILERLSKNVGDLQKSLNKFFNSSQTASTAIDVAAIMAMGNGVIHALTGNLWPLAKATGVLVGSRQVANLISDPQFLRALEDAVLTANTKNASPKMIIQAFERLAPWAQSVTPAAAETAIQSTSNP